MPYLLVDPLVGSSVDPCVDRLFGMLVGKSVGWLVCCLFGPFFMDPVLCAGLPKRI